MLSKGKKKFGPRRRQRLIGDILSARYDLEALADRQGVSPEGLSQWIGEPANHQALRGLCALADVQTQLLLSRYRLVAAGRLIKLATDESAETGADVGRRACVDLLRLDLKQSALDGAGERAEGPEEGPSLRELVLGAQRAASGGGEDGQDGEASSAAGEPEREY